MEEDLYPFRKYGCATLLSYFAKETKSDVEIYTKLNAFTSDSIFMDHVRDENMEIGFVEEIDHSSGGIGDEYVKGVQ